LTGGTALSAFYLQHRLSGDLVFLTEDEGQIAGALPKLEEITTRTGGHLQVKRSFRTYLKFLVVRADETIRCIFGLDTPYRLAETRFVDDLGVYVDSLLDLSCNKVSALFDRSEP
jgi:hypothetical protein